LDARPKLESPTLLRPGSVGVTHPALLELDVDLVLAAGLACLVELADRLLEALFLLAVLSHDLLRARSGCPGRTRRGPCHSYRRYTSRRPGTGPRYRTPCRGCCCPAAAPPAWSCCSRSRSWSSGRSGGRRSSTRT